MSSVISLGEDQQDALVELFNLGIGMAAKALSEMCGEPVDLSIPVVSFVTHDALLENVRKDVGAAMAVVSQDFDGVLWGNALMIFPEADVTPLAKSVLPDLPQVDRITADVQDVMNEVGNLILNGTFSALADALDLEVQTGVPHFRTDLGLHGPPDDIVLHTKVTLTLTPINAAGQVAVVMSLHAAEILAERLQEHLDSLHRAAG